MKNDALHFVQERYLQGGTFSFSLIQKFFSIKDSCNTQCFEDLQNNFIYEKDETKKTMFLQKKNVPMDEKKPILFFFCGIGVQENKYRFREYLNSDESSCFNPIIFSLDLFSIHDINKMIKNAADYFLEVQEKYPTFEFIFIGHSLGSGIACNTLLHLLKQISINDREKKLRVKNVILLSTYPNLSSIFELSFLKSILFYFFQNVLDNEKALIEMNNIDENILQKIHIYQGKNDKMFPFSIIKKMVERNPCFKNLNVTELKGNHYDPANVNEWGSLICSLNKNQ